MTAFVIGKPCGKCNGTKRYKSSRGCVACDRARKKNLTPEEKRAALARVQRWRANNRERYLKHRKEHYRFRVYGLTRDQFFAMLRAQDNLCVCCDASLRGGKETQVDHDHATGKVRGLLCLNCNIAIGMVRESTETLLRIGVYLEKHRG